MLELREIHYSGLVQGVGFRFTTHSIAQGLAVMGFVRNLPDGRVHLVAEGERRELDLLEQSIADRMKEHISESQRDVRPATGNYTGFSIRY